MKKIFLLLHILFFSPLMLMAQDTPIERFMQSDGLQSASVGIVIKRVSDGAVVVSHNPSQSMRLASVTKLFPTWLALEQYGPEYRYQTKIYHTGVVNDKTLLGNIILIPSADPTFNSHYFPQRDVIMEIASLLKSHNISKIDGDIIIAPISHSDHNLPGSWVWEDLSNYYAAYPHPINFRDNSYTIEFKSGDAGSKTEIINTYYKPKNLELNNQVIASESNADNAWIYGGPYSTELYIKGTIPSNRESFKIKGATSKPEEIFLDELQQAIIKENITIVGDCAIKNSLPDNQPLTDLGSIYSPTLLDIISVTNKVSCNLFAESLGELVGGDKGWKTVVKEQLTLRDIDPSSLNLLDASGLSPQSVASASNVTDLLLYITSHDYYDAFKNSLAICGQDRSLNAYGYPELSHKLMAKTGSMAGVQSLAGYVENNNKELFAFCIVVNYYTCSRSNLQKSISTLLFDILK